MLLDATAVPSDRGGVGRYVDGLVCALRRPIVVNDDVHASRGESQRDGSPHPPARARHERYAIR